MERRKLLQASGGVLLLKAETVFGYQANSTVEVGLVGCGGRGNWIAPFFPEHTGARMVAVADVMRDRLESTRAKLKVDAGRAYHGGFTKALARSDRCKNDFDSQVGADPLDARRRSVRRRHGAHVIA